MQDLHISLDGIARKCQIRVEACPFADDDEGPSRHLSLAELARAGGGRLDYGHGLRIVSSVEDGVFTVTGESRARYFRVDGSPLSGDDRRRYKRELQRGRSTGERVRKVDIKHHE